MKRMEYLITDKVATTEEKLNVFDFCSACDIIHDESIALYSRREEGSDEEKGRFFSGCFFLLSRAYFFRKKEAGFLSFKSSIYRVRLDLNL